MANTLEMVPMERGGATETLIMGVSMQLMHPSCKTTVEPSRGNEAPDKTNTIEKRYATVMNERVRTHGMRM